MSQPINTMPELKGFLFEGVAEPASIIIYSLKITSRLRYVCKFIFNQGLLCNFLLIDNETEFIQSKLPKINYSIKTFEHALNINPNGLLNENTLQKPELEYTKDNFDIFSAVFYYISRCEEWSLAKTDAHGRFVPEAIIKVPIVDIWIAELKTILSAKFKSLQFPVKAFKFISTIDVDNVFAFKAKPFFRQVGGALKDLKNLNARLAAVLFGKKDPFDEYQFQVELSKNYNVPLIYFFLYRNNTNYDRTIDPNHPEFVKLLSYLKQNNIQAALHPSYDSSISSELLNSEQKLLSKNSGKEVISSRQHFLRFNIKTTPKQLIKAGIQFDFTMGWSEKIGFRAGTTLPFYYYDFETESELPLLAIPFSAMDGAFYLHQNNNADEAYNQLMNIATLVKSVNGLFITVIHDRSFSDAIAPGWKNLYLKLHENLKA
ncbi:MAG TPA: polysaccharide deacetylase family protein [Bacteroidia bacterium]|jgi:hypothetical protein|nr:polysaccharide deacetylase family protein [Bacteroidia bacterium]